MEGEKSDEREIKCDISKVKREGNTYSWLQHILKIRKCCSPSFSVSVLNLSV